MYFQCSSTDYLTQNEFDRLGLDCRIIIYNDFVFCEKKDVADLQSEYDLSFVDASSVLFDMFVERFKLNENCLLDLDLMFKDNLNIVELKLNDNWIKVVREIFISNLKWMMDNYDLAEKSYFSMLGELGLLKDEMIVE